MKLPLINKQEKKTMISNNKFITVVIATQRAKQIHKGALPLVRISSKRATRIALEEVEQGLISFEFIPEELDQRSRRDNRADPKQDNEAEDNREVTNQALVASQSSVARIGD
jgi:DNA-directed RNA polymerase omega subunit